MSNNKAEKVTNPEQYINVDVILAEISARMITAGSISLPQMEGEPAAPVEYMQTMVFLLGETYYAVEISSVNELIRSPDVTPIPGILEWVWGVTNIHGQIVSVVDLAHFLDAGFITSLVGSSLIILEAKDQTIGLLVDSVQPIFTFPIDQIISPPFPVNLKLASYLRGAVERGGEFVRLLDCESLLTGEEMQQFV